MWRKRGTQYPPGKVLPDFQDRVPILIIGFNRPEMTGRVVDALREHAPSRVFLALDGPRDNEQSLVNEVEKTVRDRCDWGAQLKIHRNPENLGCRRAVVTALNWFFSEVEEGIILEDDCVPGSDFLPFCEEMLELYRDSPKVFHIAGDNSAGVKVPDDWSYCFIRHPHIWGWATWRHAWSKYDADMREWRSTQTEEFLAHTYPEQDARRTWARRLNEIAHSNDPGTWDYQWVATLALHGGLAVQPTRNLIRNIGFGSGGTRTKKITIRADYPVTKFRQFIHPPQVERLAYADEQVFNNTHSHMDPERDRGFVARAQRYALSHYRRARDQARGIATDKR